MASEKLTADLEEVFTSKRKWGERDTLPEEFINRASHPELHGALVRAVTSQFACKSLSRSFFAAVCIRALPDIEWGRDVASRLAKHLKAEREGMLIGNALKQLAASDHELPYILMRKYILDCPVKQIQADLLFDFGSVGLASPEFYLDCVKKVALDAESGMVLSGAIPQEVSALPPSEDDRLLAFLGVVKSSLADANWQADVADSKFVDLLWDYLRVASIIVSRELFEDVLDIAIEWLSRRPVDDPGLAVLALVGPLGLWGDSLAEYAPWMEEVYITRLTRIPVSSPLYKSAQELLHVVRSPRTPVSPRIAKGQTWRKYAKERAQKYSARSKSHESE